VKIGIAILLFVLGERDLASLLAFKTGFLGLEKAIMKTTVSPSSLSLHLPSVCDFSAYGKGGSIVPSFL
jgi:hypothetical protein